MNKTDYFFWGVVFCIMGIFPFSLFAVGISFIVIGIWLEYKRRKRWPVQ